MSSEARCIGGLGRSALVGVLLLAAGAPSEGSSEAVAAPFWAAAQIEGRDLSCLAGHRADEILVVSCRASCVAVPWQLDERDAEGQPALDQGPEPNPDDPPGILDENDELLWMLSDAGRRMLPSEARADADCGVEMRARQGDFEGFVYAFAVAAPAARSASRYVDYAPGLDRMSGARVTIGFGGPTPRYIAVRPTDGEPEANLLDRLKVRASARFLGLIPLGRDEDDIETELVAWRAGPIRVTRRQRQWVRLGFGLRTPIFRSDTLFYRDYGVLSVHLRLNYRATFFFSAIEVQAVLDFRDLRGWRILAPGLAAPLIVGSLDGEEAERLNGIESDWFALGGPAVTFVQRLVLGPTLASVRRRLLFRLTREPRGPEAESGEQPGLGYRLTRWNEVDRGAHWFASINYALPADYDVSRFLAEVDEPLSIQTRTVHLHKSPSIPLRQRGKCGHAATQPPERGRKT